MKKRLITIAFILALIFELIFKSSNLPALFALDLLVLLFIAMLTKQSSYYLITIFLVTSMTVDLFDLKIIGLTSLSLFIAIFIVKISGNSISFFSLERKSFVGYFLIYCFYILIKYLLDLWLNNAGTFNLFAFLENLALLILFIWIIGKVVNSKYALK